MEPTERIAVVREGLRDQYERYAQLVEGLEDASIPLPPSEWTIREAAVHVSGGPRRYGALVLGDVDLSNVPLDKEFLDARQRSLIGDNAETDLKKLADETRASIEHFLKVTDGLPPDHPIAYYAGLRPVFGDMVPVLLGEPLVHGYDIASAAGRPWPIDPRYAAMVVGATGFSAPHCSSQPQPSASRPHTESTSREPTRSSFASRAEPTRSFPARRPPTV